MNEVPNALYNFKAKNKYTHKQFINETLWNIYGRQKSSYWKSIYFYINFIP